VILLTANDFTRGWNRPLNHTEVTTMKKLLITIFSLFALMSASTYAMAEEGGLWEKTKAGANTAIEWTAEKSQQSWNATKQGVAHMAEWTGKKSSIAWEATKKGSRHAAAWTAEKSKKGWDATKQSASNVGKRMGHKTEKTRQPDPQHVKGMAV